LERLHEIFSRSRSEAFYRTIRWRELGAFFRDFGPGTSDMVWTFRDPLPAPYELAGRALAIANSAVKGVVRRAAPTWILREFQTARELGGSTGISYLGSRAANWLHGKQRRPLPARVESILFVCHGNIIRSALAEALLRQRLPDGAIRVGSAGVDASPGRRSDERARAAARELGVSLDQHRSRALTDELLEGADVVFVMDELNEAHLLRLAPEAKAKVRFLGEWSQGRSRAINDPYLGSAEDVRKCAGEIEACTAELAKALVKARDAGPAS
jgi:protein-tyrosine phosphatase